MIAGGVLIALASMPLPLLTSTLARPLIFQDPMTVCDITGIDNAWFLAQGLGYDFIGVDFAGGITYGEFVSKLEEANLPTPLEGLEDLQDSHGLIISCFDNLLFVQDPETGWQLHIFDAEQSLARIAYFEDIGIPISFTRISDSVIAMTIAALASRITLTFTVVDLDTSNILLSGFDFNPPISRRSWVTLSLDNYILIHQYFLEYESTLDNAGIDHMRDITYYLFELQDDTVVQIATCEPVLIPEDGNDQFSPYALLSPDGLIVPSYVSPITYKVENCNNINDILLGR